MTDKLLKRHPEAESHPSGERVVVFHKTTKNSIVLNPTGSWLWEQLEQPRSRQELVERLVERYPDVERQRLADDMEVYLRELTDNELVVS
jgi:hypothetical protein